MNCEFRFIFSWQAGTAGAKAMKQEFYDNIFEHPWPTTYIGKCYYAFMLRKIDLVRNSNENKMKI